MKQQDLDQKIHGFLDRKQHQYPDLSRSVASITKELVAQERAASVLHMVEEPRAEELDSAFEGRRFGHMQYAI